MKSRSTITLILLCMLVLPSASAQLPRVWQSITLPDIDPAPYVWDPATCAVRHSSAGWTDCVSELRIPSTGASLEVTIRWVESRDAPKLNCGSETLAKRQTSNLFTGAPMTTYGITSSRNSVQAIFGLTRSAPPDFDPAVLARIGRDFLKKITPFTVECNSGGAPPPRDDPPSQVEQDRWRNKPDELPPCGVVFGQDDPDRQDPSKPQKCKDVPPSGDSRALRSLPAVFPAGTKLEPVRLFPGAGPPETDFARRPYSIVFSARDLDVVFWELRARYPGQRSDKPFAIVYRLYKNGTLAYTSPPKSFYLEAGAGERYSAFTAGTGEPGYWTPGAQYRYELVVDGTPIAVGDFRVQ